MMNKEIEIYTDGSSLGNPGPGGWGTVVVVEGKIVDELGGHDKDTTNNRMELQAVIEALKHIHKHHKESIVKIHADSSYVLNGITSWIFGWEKNGWRTANKKAVMNQELWKELISLVREFKGKIIWEKVKGHSGHVYNDKADEIATEYAAKKR